MELDSVRAHVQEMDSNALAIKKQQTQNAFTNAPSKDEFPASLIIAYLKLLQEEIGHHEKLKQHADKLKHIIEVLGNNTLYSVNLPGSMKGDAEQYEFLRRKFSLVPEKKKVTFKLAANVIRAG